MWFVKSGPFSRELEDGVYVDPDFDQAKTLIIQGDQAGIIGTDPEACQKAFDNLDRSYYGWVQDAEFYSFSHPQAQPWLKLLHGLANNGGTATITEIGHEASPQTKLAAS